MENKDTHGGVRSSVSVLFFVWLFLPRIVTSLTHTCRTEFSQLLSLLAPSPLSWAPTAVTWTTVRPSQMSLSPSGRSARFSSAPHAYCVSALSDSSPWSRSSSMLHYVHRDHKDYSGLRVQDGHLDFHTSPELCNLGHYTEYFMKLGTECKTEPARLPYCQRVCTDFAAVPSEKVSHLGDASYN